MKITNRWFLTGFLSGALATSLAAQDGAKPADDQLKAPENVGAAPADAMKTESGLASIVLKKGTGTEKPTATDTVKVHYTGWQASDGKKFDSSLDRGQPAEFPLNQVIKGWTEGVQLMVEGEKRRFWIPADMAYGKTPSRPGAPSGDLTFDVELLEIIKPPETPKELVAPADALATESGLKSKILKEGEGDATPGATDIVTVHFTGWKADGEFLMTTTREPVPRQFPVDQLPMKGWTEGLQLMKKGEKRRFWIPADLAFGKEGEARPGAPAGDLIFDFELLNFKEKPKPPAPPRDPNAPEDVAAAPEGAAKTESGIAYKVLAPGKGDASPGDNSLVKINFSGWDTNGASLGTTKQMGGPLTVFFDEPQVTGWVEVLKMMKMGEKRRVWIPEALAGPRIIGRGALTFDLELVSFKPKPVAPETPADVAAPPADAKKTPSGLAYKVLREGIGTRKPTKSDRVKVHYAGWTTDGKMFDNSIERDQLFEFSPAGGVIQGWLEGIKLMVEGEKTRFWIPVEMAYNNAPGKPAGMLVFDIELVEFATPPPAKKIEAVTPPIEVKPPQPKEEKPAKEEEPKEKE
jgi:FKBP-type peptidyl-prolyl cis-trans isomerase